MSVSASLDTLSNKDSFRARRAAAWERNVAYWLRGPLRHVVDVGDYIAERAITICRISSSKRATIVDMGCGDCWLLRALLGRGVSFGYVGLDCTKAFVDYGQREFSKEAECSFEVVDLELPTERMFNADLVINAFNFFELCDLEQGFANAAQFLKLGGTLLMSTIDKTYLLLALSRDWPDFMRMLREYAEVPGIKYSFQAVDLGDRASEVLVYPSVLYSTQDYLTAAGAHGFELMKYTESAFTGKPIPKIYCHFEFRKAHAQGARRKLGR